MTFSRTRPPTTDDDLPPVGVSGADRSIDAGGARLHRLRGLDPTLLPTLDPGSRHSGPAQEGEDVTWWRGAEGLDRETSSAGPGRSAVDRRPSRSTSGSGSGAEDEERPWERDAPRLGPLFAVAEAYTAANGHPTTHSGFEHVHDGGPRRWSVGARTAVVAAVTVLLLAIVVGAWALADGDDLRPVAALGAPGAEHDVPGTVVGEGPGDDDSDGSRPEPGAVPGQAAEEGTSPSAVRDVVVHVVGAVAAPGLVTVPEGSRVADALAAAGDATGDADLAGVNLAREVVDGEQIVVPRPGEVVAAVPQPGPGGAAPATGPLDLNSADEAALDALSGIGPVLAARIVEWREANGPFTTVEELGEVSGIGDALLARLRDQVRV
ncbi:ComEA family DNA-binding protein [Oerskovia jenensis]|uniref:ComEA family DNA-binding protein n=1 Tax=Oerskovia jenensis TaxID=162169 RepID=UPI0036DF921D